MIEVFGCEIEPAFLWTIVVGTITILMAFFAWCLSRRPGLRLHKEEIPEYSLIAKSLSLKLIRSVCFINRNENENLTVIRH